LEYVPGTGKTQHLLHNKHTYYRIAKTKKWVCKTKSCFISLTINADETGILRQPKAHKHDHLTDCLYLYALASNMDWTQFVDDDGAGVNVGAEETDFSIDEGDDDDVYDSDVDAGEGVEPEINEQLNQMINDEILQFDTLF
jgi:hypothetical protein